MVTRWGGLTHEGSALAEKIEKDDSKADLDKTGTIDLKTGFGSELTL